MAAHVEEALEGVLAGRVVGVEVVFLVRALLRLLDVVEHVLGNFLENFRRSRFRHTCVECAAQVSDIIILLSLLESVEFASQDLVPLFDVEASLLNLVEHASTHLILIFTFNHSQALLLVISVAKFVLSDATRDLLFGDFVEDGSILKSLGTSKRLEDSLLERAEFVAA